MDQCGLCLSCGAPFLPGEDDARYFNHPGNLSVLYLNGEFRRHPEMVDRYEKPKFTGPRQEAHVIHGSHHEPAVLHMQRHHKCDNSLNLPTAGASPSSQAKRPFPFFQIPSKNQHPRMAAWKRPEKDERIDFEDLLTLLGEIGNAVDSNRQNLSDSCGATYITCQGCNLVMTQKSNFEFILGCNPSATRSRPDPLVKRDKIKVCQAGANGETLSAAYEKWTCPHPDNFTEHPDRGDCIDPLLAYYLHMCLPWVSRENENYFKRNRFGKSHAKARELYIELCWLVLEISCLLRNLSLGKSYNQGKHSHGIKEQLGPLDFYVSFFMWRLVQYENLDELHGTSVDFIQWHQKYFCEAEFCPDLFDRIPVVMGADLDVDINATSRVVVEEVCRKLVRLYREKLRRVGWLVVGKNPHETENLKTFFASPDVISTFMQISRLRVTPNDFDGMLARVGVTVLLSRVLQLCVGIPDEVYRELKDFNREWQWKEIANVRRRNKGTDALGAYSLYALCNLRDAPDEVPRNYLKLKEVLAREKCSPWRSVLALRRCKAFDADDDE